MTSTYIRCCFVSVPDHLESHQIKSPSSIDSYSFKGTDETTTLAKEQIENSQQTTFLSWNEETPDALKSSSSSDLTVEIPLPDLGVNLDSNTQVQVNRTNVPTISNDSILKDKNMENEKLISVSTLETDLNSSLFHESSRKNLNSTKTFIPSFPTSCAELSEENIALTHMKNPAMKNRYSLPLAKITDYSSSGEVV